MLISNLLENSSNVITSDETISILNSNNILFENNILLAENKLMETQMVALNEMLTRGLTLSENVSNLQIIQENALTDFLKTIKDAFLAMCKKIKEVFQSIFKSEKKSTNDISSSMSDFTEKLKKELNKIDYTGSKVESAEAAVEKINKVKKTIRVIDMDAVLSWFNFDNAGSIIDKILNDQKNTLTSMVSNKEDPFTPDKSAELLLKAEKDFSQEFSNTDGFITETAIREAIVKRFYMNYDVTFKRNLTILKSFDLEDIQAITDINSKVNSDMARYTDNLSKTVCKDINDRVIIIHLSKVSVQLTKMLNNYTNAVSKEQLVSKRIIEATIKELSGDVNKIVTDAKKTEN